MSMEIEIVSFWILTSCSDVVGYHRFLRTLLPPNKNSYRPPPVILTSLVNIISFQKVIKRIAHDQISLRTTGAGILIVTHCVALSYLSEHNLDHLTFYPQSEQ